MRLRHAAVCAVLGASLAGTAPLLEAQQSEAPAPSQSAPPPTFTVQAQLVNLPVVVRNKSGALVTTLDKGDFELAIDGRQQPIRYFDRDKILPLTLGLLVDISGSVRSALDYERAASEVFLDQMVTSPAGQADPPDQAFLIQFAHEVDLPAGPDALGLPGCAPLCARWGTKTATFLRITATPATAGTVVDAAFTAAPRSTTPFILARTS